MIKTGNYSLVVQWLGLQALNVEGPGSAPGWGTDLLHGSAKKKRRYRSKYQNSQLKEVKVVFL